MRASFFFILISSLILLSACASEQPVRPLQGIVSLREGTLSDPLYVKLIETAEERQVVLEDVHLTWLVLWRSAKRTEKLSFFKAEGYIKNERQVRVEILDLDLEIWADGKRLALEDKYTRFERYLDPGSSSFFKIQAVSPILAIVDLLYDVKLEWADAGG